MDIRIARPGDVIRNTRTGNKYRVDRITPAGAAGRSYSSGPTVHAQPIRDDGTLGDFRADIRDDSSTYPASEWEPFYMTTVDRRQTCACHLNSTGHGHFSGCRNA